MEADQIDLDNEPNDLSTSFQKNFGWFFILNRVAENDITKHRTVLEKKIIEVLNQLTYIVQYELVQQKLAEQALKKQN